MTAPVPGPLAVDASLHLLADHLADALEAGELAPSLLEVSALDGTAFELGTRPLLGEHPTELLTGFTAPPDLHAVGLATGGWAYHLAERGDPDRARTRVQIVTLVSRTGELVHRTRTSDPALSSSLRDEAPAGEQVDLLRLALGLATDPPPCDASTYWTIQWLSALLATSPPWPDDLVGAAAHHPAMRLLDTTDTRLDRDVVDVLDGFHRVCTWRRLQLLAAEGAFPLDELRPSQIHWFDEGAFARFVLNRCPGLQALREELLDRAPHALTRSILGVLDALGVPDSAWPDRAAPPAAD